MARCLIMFVFLTASSWTQPFGPSVLVSAQGSEAIEVGERILLTSEIMGEQRPILVRTPPGYDQGGIRYPVLYMTDGPGHFLHTCGTIEFLARNGRMPEMIVVGIANTDRTRDLTPTRASMTQPDGSSIPFPTSGGANRFLDFFAKELIPHIEKSYRTQPYRVFSGHSFGGLFAIHAFATRPELFHATIAVSPTLMWDDGLPLKQAKEFFRGKQRLNKTLVVTLGSEGPQMQRGFDSLEQILAHASAIDGFESETRQMPDEDHGSVVLRSHYHGFLKIFDGWQLPRDPETGAIAGGFDGAREHYQRLTKRFGFAIRIPELLVNQLGYQALERDIAKAIEIFKFNIEKYPNSANVYDSLAEAYEKDGQLKLARDHYRKAVRRGTELQDPSLAVYQRNLERVQGELKKARATADF